LNIDMSPEFRCRRHKIWKWKIWKKTKWKKNKKIFI